MTTTQKKLDKCEWLMLAATVWGALMGTILSALFFLFVGV